MAIKHTKVSAKPDGADATLVLPSDWNASHTVEPGSITEAMQVLADNATNDVSATKHGYAPKAPGNTTTFLRGDAAWAVPSSAVAWTGITAGSGSATTANGDSAIVYQVAQTSAGRISWRFSESAAGVSTGSPVLVQIDSISGSTAIPFLVKVGTKETFRIRSDGGGVDVAGTFELRDGTNPQEFRVFNTYTNATNYELARLVWVGNVAYLQTDAAGTGSAREMRVGTGGAAPFRMRTAGVDRWSLGATTGHFLPGEDNTYDIGDGVSRVRDMHMGRWLQQSAVAANPGTGDLTAGAEVAIYNKANKFVLAYNNAGTITYVSIPLDGSSTAWTHSTVAP